MSKLSRAIFTIGGMTMLSRFVGLIRDLLIAGFLGAGPIADAFFVALKTPNLFRRFSAEGALSAAFVPVFSSLLVKDKKSAEEFANTTLSMMVFILVPFCVIMMAIMPWFIYIIAPGFSNNPAQFDLAVQLSRITFPFLMFTSLVALFGGMLNSIGKYAPFAGAPILFNLCLIASVLLPNMFDNISYQLAMAVTISGVLQLILMMFFIYKSSLKVKIFKPKITKDERKFLKLMGHGILGSGIVQINVFVGTLLASLLPAGAISYIYYADRLNQLPIGVIGVAIGTATLPMLSEAIAQKNSKKALSLFNSALLMGLFFAISCAVTLLILAEPIINLIFNHGKFNLEDVKNTTYVLQAFATGIPAYIMVKILANVFFANHDTRTPMIISSISAVSNIIISIILLKPLGCIGIALATSLSSWISVFLLNRKSNLEINRETKVKIGILAILSLVMGTIFIFGKEIFSPYLMTGSFIVQAIYLMLLLFVGGMTMVILSFLTKVISFTEFKTILKIKSKK